MTMNIIVCVYVTGLLPALSKDTLVTVPVVDKLENNSWEAKIIEQKDTGIKLSVNTSPTAPIGRYELSVKTWTPKGSNTYLRKPENDIYLLFNPWCEGKHEQKYDRITTSINTSAHFQSNSTISP